MHKYLQAKGTSIHTNQMEGSYNQGIQRGAISSSNFPTTNYSTPYFEGGLWRSVSKSKVVKGAIDNNNRYFIWKNGLWMNAPLNLSIQIKLP